MERRSLAVPGFANDMPTGLNRHAIPDTPSGGHEKARSVIYAVDLEEESMWRKVRLTWRIIHHGSRKAHMDRLLRPFQN